MSSTHLSFYRNTYFYVWCFFGVDYCFVFVPFGLNFGYVFVFLFDLWFFFIMSLVTAAFHRKFVIFDWFINWCLMSYSWREQIQLTYQREKIERDKKKIVCATDNQTLSQETVARNELIKSYLHRACNSTNKRHGLSSHPRGSYISSCTTSEPLVRRGCILRHSYCVTGTREQDIKICISPFFL